MTALRPECRAIFGFIKIPKISLWLREFMRGEVPSLQDHPVSKRRGWSSKGTQPFEPEESKETAPGFRGTRLCPAKSSVLYLCEGEGNESRLYASCSNDCKPIEIKAGRWCKLHPSASLFALCGAKVYQAPPQRPSYFFARFPLWLAPPLSRFDFLQISTSQCFSLSVNLL